MSPWTPHGSEAFCTEQFSILHENYYLTCLLWTSVYMNFAIHTLHVIISDKWPHYGLHYECLCGHQRTPNTSASLAKIESKQRFYTLQDFQWSLLTFNKHTICVHETMYHSLWSLNSAWTELTYCACPNSSVSTVQKLYVIRPYFLNNHHNYNYHWLYD